MPNHSGKGETGREEVRHNSAAFLLLFINWIIVALKALHQVRVKMCKPLKQIQPSETCNLNCGSPRNSGPCPAFKQEINHIFFENYLLICLLALLFFFFPMEY